MHATPSSNFALLQIALSSPWSYWGRNWRDPAVSSNHLNCPDKTDIRWCWFCKIIWLFHRALVICRQFWLLSQLSLSSGQNLRDQISSDPSTSEHLSTVVRMCFNSIRQIRPCLSFTRQWSLWNEAHPPVLSNVGFCNNVCTWFRLSQSGRLQVIVDMAGQEREFAFQSHQ